MQETEERISGVEDAIQNINPKVKIMWKLFNQIHPGNTGHNEKPKSKVIGVHIFNIYHKHSQPKGPVNYKITGGKLP